MIAFALMTTTCQKLRPRCWCRRYPQHRHVRRRLQSPSRNLRSSVARWRSRRGSLSSWWRSCGRCQRRRRLHCRQSSWPAPAHQVPVRMEASRLRDNCALCRYQQMCRPPLICLIISNKHIQEGEEEEKGVGTQESNWNGAICQPRPRW